MGWGKKFKSVTKVTDNVVNTVKDTVTNPKTALTAGLTGGLSTQAGFLTGKSPTELLTDTKTAVDGKQNIDRASLLTPEQEQYLSAITKQANSNLNTVNSGYTSLANSGSAYGTPAAYKDTYAANNYDTSRNSFQANNYQSRNSYQGDLNYNNENTYAGLDYDNGNAYNAVNNWENEFQNGVVNPAMSELSKQIANTKHSSNLHSSANRAAQDELRQDLLNYLASQRYNNVMQQQQYKQQAAENQYSRGLTAAQINAANRLSANESYQDRAMKAAITNQAQKQSAYENQYQRDLTNLGSESALRQQANEAQNQLMYNTMSGNAQNQMTANQAYNDYNLNQQKLKQQAEEDAYNRRLAGLNGLSGLSQQALGTKAYENIISHENGILDYATAGANMASAGANVMKALPLL